MARSGLRHHIDRIEALLRTAEDRRKASAGGGEPGFREILDELEAMRRALGRAGSDTGRQDAALLDYRELFELAPDGYLLTDLDGVITEASRVAASLLETSHEELIGRRLEGFVPAPYRQPYTAKTEALHVGRAGRVQDWQLTFEPGRGTAFDAEVTVEPKRDLDGAITGLRWLLRDVTERRRAEAALRESEALFRATFENAAVGIRVADVASGGRILQANSVYQRMMGYSEEELRRRTFFDITHPDDVAENRRLFQELVAGERRWFQMEKRYVRKDGSVFWARLTVSPVRGEDGRAVFVIGVVEDISERHRTQRELRDALARSRALLASAVDGILTIDEKGTIGSVNPAAERIFGYTAEELLGQKINVLMPPPDRDQHDGYLDNYLRTGEAQIIGIGREVSGLRRDGEVFPLDLAVSEVRLGDRRIFMGTVRDITERKAAEAARRREREFAESLLDTAQAIVLVLDAEGRILRFNRYMEELSGYRLEGVQGADWLETFIPAEDREEIRRLFTTTIDENPAAAHVNPILSKDGSRRLIEWHNTVLRDPEGHVTGVLSVGQDITERQELEEQLRQAQKMEAVGRLAGGIAHDFNTLLGSCMGYAELLLEQLPEDDHRRRSAEQILRGTQRGAGLTRQLLTFSRRRKARLKVLDLRSVLGGMEDMLRRLLGADIELRLRLASELGFVRAEPSDIEQILMNLAVNAADAMPRGGRLRVEASNLPRGEGPLGVESVALVVADTGCGMEPATRRRIFEPFYTTKDVGKGTGLGLSTVYAIVEKCGGQIAVESEPGVGSTFRLYFPRCEGPAEGPERPRQVTAGGGSESLLVVEDDQMFRELIQETLEASGYRVLAAADPEEALMLCERHRGTLDLTLTDMVMPGMNGSELAERLRSLYPRMKILFMSGYADDDLMVRATEGASVELLAKPFSTQELLLRVRQELGQAPRKPGAGG